MYNHEDNALNEYIEDVNEIFMECKKLCKYSEFTTTSKKSFAESIEKCKEEAIKAVTEMLNDGADRGSMLEVISFIQEKTTELLTIYKIRDTLFKNDILNYSYEWWGKEKKKDYVANGSVISFSPQNFQKNIIEELDDNGDCLKTYNKLFFPNDEDSPSMTFQERMNYLS